MEEAPPSDNLYVSELPTETTEETLRQIFGPTVTQCKVLPSKIPGSTRVALVRFGTVKEASHVRVLLNGAIPPGCSKPVCIRFSGNVNGKGGKGGSSGMHRSEPYSTPSGALWNQEAQMWPELAHPGACGTSQIADGGEAPPSDNLYVTGLPVGLDNDTLKAMFTQYGAVVQCKVLETLPNHTSAHALVRFSTIEEAVVVKQALSGYMMQGLSEPLTVNYAIQKNANQKNWPPAAKQAQTWPPAAQQAQTWPPAAQQAQTGEICHWFLKGECWSGDRCSRIHSSG